MSLILYIYIDAKGKGVGLTLGIETMGGLHGMGAYRQDSAYL